MRDLPTGRRALVLAALWLATLVVGLDTMVLSVALSSLSRQLGATTSDLQWVTDAYTLTLAALLIPVGLLGDRFGRRTVLLAGLAVFGAASLACAEAGSPAQLIAARAVLGLGAAVLISVPLSVLPTVFDPAGRARAMSILVSGMMLGLPLGPILGGWLLEHYWWGSVFLINVPVVLAALVVVAVAVPQSRDRTSGRPDIAGVVLSALGLTALVYGVIEGPDKGWGSPVVLGCLAAGAAMLAGFAVRQARARTPLIRPSLFADRRFGIGVTAMTFASFALFGVVFMLPQYLQVVLGNTALGGGVRLLPMIGGIVLGAAPSDRVARRLGRRVPVAAGMAVLAAGLLLHSRITVHSGYPLTAVALAVEGLGIGLALSPAMDSALSAFRADESGVGSSVIQSIRQVGASLSIAALGSVLNAAYRSRLDPSLHHLPPQAAHAARGSVTGAAAVADRLGPLGPALRTAANAAFTHAMSVVLVVCAGAALAGAIAVVALLPDRDKPVAVPATADAGTPGRRPEPAAVPASTENRNHER